MANLKGIVKGTGVVASKVIGKTLDVMEPKDDKSDMPAFKEKVRSSAGDWGASSRKVVSGGVNRVVKAVKNAVGS